MDKNLDTPQLSVVQKAEDCSRQNEDLILKLLKSALGGSLLLLGDKDKWTPSFIEHAKTRVAVFEERRKQATLLLTQKNRVLQNARAILTALEELEYNIEAVTARIEEEREALNNPQAPSHYKRSA